MLSTKVKEKNKKSQEKRYVIQLCFNWTCRAKNKKKAEDKAREEFLRKLKDINSLTMQPHIEEIHENERKDACAS
jgi:dsRNA-specific ribonuclease